MSDVPAAVLRTVIDASNDPVMVVQSEQSDWPVRIANAAFRGLADDVELDAALAEVCEALFGRDTALDVSEAVRSREATRIPVDMSGREYILGIAPLGSDDTGYTAIFLRHVSAGGTAADPELSQALLKAKKRVRDLSRDDPATGLLNERAFRDVLAHDWAVASREQSTLALVSFTLVDFDAYVHVFGRHASDSCLRRVGQSIRRCLRRASDVIARVDDATFVVLSHASDEAKVRQFADGIAASVRELRIHHPRSSEDRFVTVDYRVVSTDGPERLASADAFLDALFEA